MSYSCQRYWSSLRVFKSFAAWMECFFFSFIWKITVSFNSCLQLLKHDTYNSSLPLSVGNTESSHGQEFDRTKLWLCLKGFPRHWPIIFFFKMKSRYVRILKEWIRIFNSLMILIWKDSLGFMAVEVVVLLPTAPWFLQRKLYWLKTPLQWHFYGTEKIQTEVNYPKSL